VSFTSVIFSLSPLSRSLSSLALTLTLFFTLSLSLSLSLRSLRPTPATTTTATISIYIYVYISWLRVTLATSREPAFKAELMLPNTTQGMLMRVEKLEKATLDGLKMPSAEASSLPATVNAPLCGAAKWSVHMLTYADVC